MRAFMLSVLITLLGVSTPASGAIPLAITDVTVVDVVTGRELPHRTVVVRGDRIAAVAPASRAVPRGVERISGRGQWLIPGLWDMHMHALTDHRYTYFFPLLIAHGVTAVREMGSNLPPAEINRIRLDIASGKLLGPHFAEATFRLLDGPGTKFPRNAAVLATPNEARSVVLNYRRQGADFAKPYNLLGRDTYRAVVNEARRLGQPIEGHIPFSIRAIDAARLGQRSFEHNFGVLLSVSRDEASLRQLLLGGSESWGRIEAKAATSYDEAKAQLLFAEMRRHGVWSCPTISNVHMAIIAGQSPALSGAQYAYVPPWEARSWASFIDRQMTRNRTIAELRELHFATMQRLIREMHRANVGILAGTDSGAVGTVAGFSLHDELGELVQLGMPPVDALRSATILPARFTHKERTSGSITPGKRADLVLLAGDPLTDIGNTRRITAVMRAGHWFDRDALDRLMEQARKAALAAPKPTDLPND